MSTETIAVRPAKGLIVRDPGTGKALPATGAQVPKTAYWLRRLRDGDVVDTAAEKPEPEHKSSKRGDK